MMDRVLTPVGIEETLLELRLRNQGAQVGISCPHCGSRDCRRIDETKAECLTCGEVFVSVKEAA